jgi:mannose-6-phosphate isomerase-like protein (cupin superfamily)
MISKAFATVALCAAVAGTAASAQAAASQQPPPAPREPPANNRAGIAVDLYVGDAARSPARISHDVIFTQSILSAGDPARPPAPGAALQFNKEVALATLQPLNVTPLVRMPEQIVLYVQSGEGRLDDGAQAWDLKPGIAVLIPPNQAHRLAASAGGPLKMIMYTRMNEPGTVARKDILVRDVNIMVMTERNVHWSNMAKYVFLGPDGLAPQDHVYIVYMGPRTIAGPHAHSPGQEEIWVKLTDGPALMQLGSEIRPWPAYAGFVAPPNAQTVHAAINTSDEIQAWFYYSRLQPGPPERPAMPGNAVIAEALERSNVPGRPLEPAAPRGR